MGDFKTTYTRISISISHDMDKLKGYREKLQKSVKQFTEVTQKLDGIYHEVDDAWISDTATIFKNGIKKQKKSITTLISQYKSVIKLVDKRIAKLEERERKSKQFWENIREQLPNVGKSVGDLLEK